MARLWRVSHFVLSDFLQLPLDDFKGLEMESMLPGLPPLRTRPAAEEGGAAPSTPSSPGSAAASGAEDGSAPTSAPGSPAAAPRRQGILKDKGSPGAKDSVAVDFHVARRVATMGRRRVSFHSEQTSPFREAMGGTGAGLARSAAAAAALPEDTACLKEGWDVVAPHVSSLWLGRGTDGETCRGCGTSSDAPPVSP